MFCLCQGLEGRSKEIQSPVGTTEPRLFAGASFALKELNCAFLANSSPDDVRPGLLLLRKGRTLPEETETVLSHQNFADGTTSSILASARMDNPMQIWENVKQNSVAWPR
jgi:hypothetical protein